MVFPGMRANRVHKLRSSHVRSRSSLLSEDCKFGVFIFHDVASENDAALINPECLAELAIFDVAKVHQRPEVSRNPRRLTLSHDLSLRPNADNVPRLTRF